MGRALVPAVPDQLDRIAQIDPGIAEPAPSLCLSDADGLRASKLEHPVQGTDGDGRLGSAASVRPRAQGIPDHSFGSADEVSTRARRVYPDLFCQPMRPCSAML